MFHVFPVVTGGTPWAKEGENGNFITITQSNVMSLADKWVHYTHKLPCSIHSQLWRKEQHEVEEEENGNLITTTQCNAMLLADEWMHDTHPLSCSMDSQLWEGRTCGGRRRKQQINKKTHNAMQCMSVADEWMHHTRCHVPCIPICERENSMRGRKGKKAT